VRITPRDIRQQQFIRKLFRGIDPREVEAFLEGVAEDYEAVLREAALLREQVVALEERARGVAEREKTLQDALVTAERLGEDIKGAARREAELVVHEAQARAEKLVEASRGEEAKLRADILMLKRLRRQAAEELRALLERYERLMQMDTETEAVPDGDDGG
jgi:cell division initiation protein